MRFSRLVLIVAAALPLGACFMTAEQIAARDAADDDAACRSAGLKPATPAFAKCLDDRSRMRVAQAQADAARDRTLWSLNQANQQQMMMMRH